MRLVKSLEIVIPPPPKIFNFRKGETYELTDKQGRRYYAQLTDDLSQADGAIIGNTFIRGAVKLIKFDLFFECRELPEN